MSTMGCNWAEVLKRAVFALGFCALCSCATTSDVTALKQYADEHRHETAVPLYMGSKGGYHHIHFGTRIFRIPESELTIAKTFPLTKNPKEWTLVPIPK